MPSGIIGAGFILHGVIAAPGYSLFLLPWAGAKSEAVLTRAQYSAALGGGAASGPGVQSGNRPAWDWWFDSGTYKLAVIYLKDTDEGIATFYLDYPTTVGSTIDMYNASQTYNNYSEMTGIVPGQGVHTFSFVANSKNGSSVGYQVRPQSIAWIRTGS